MVMLDFESSPEKSLAPAQRFNRKPETVALERILDAHRAWLAGDSDGARANLSGIALAEANLEQVNLERAILKSVNLIDGCGSVSSGSDRCQAGFCPAGFRKPE
jgi:uncharacterized protein YjbI with pentapeptide repeats